MTTTKQVSKCCKAPLSVVRGNEGTSHWKCTQCGKPSDPFVETKQKQSSVVNTFGSKIKEILRKNGYNYRVRVFPQQDKVLKNGKRFIQEYEKVVIYAGRSIEVRSSKRSTRLIAWKNTKGEWEGDLETLKQHGKCTGSALYVTDYHDKVKPVKHTLYSDLWEESEKEFGGQEQELLKIMKSWKFQ